MLIERKNYPHLAQPVGPYVHAVKYNGLLFLSGLTAFGTPAQQGDMAEQAQEIFTQIQRIAVAEHTDLTSLLKVTVFVTHFDDVTRLREVLYTYYEQDLPASALVKVSGLFSPDLCIEIEAVLAVAS